MRGRKTVRVRTVTCDNHSQLRETADRNAGMIRGRRHSHGLINTQAIRGGWILLSQSDGTHRSLPVVNCKSCFFCSSHISWTTSQNHFITCGGIDHGHLRTDHPRQLDLPWTDIARYLSKIIPYTCFTHRRVRSVPIVFTALLQSVGVEILLTANQELQLRRNRDVESRILRRSDIRNFPLHMIGRSYLFRTEPFGDLAVFGDHIKSFFEGIELSLYRFIQ